jgi:hypothetical protein
MSGEPSLEPTGMGGAGAEAPPTDAGVDAATPAEEPPPTDAGVDAEVPPLM